MKKIFTTILTLFSLSNFAAPTRLKDLVTVKGVRENPIIGYGLVIGLNGSGDGGGEITNTSLKKMFEKLGLNPKSEITSKNVAAVIVTAKLPPFARMGQKIDITVSSIGEGRGNVASATSGQY
jgi:flagellar P-ring protein precursor FlgI